MRSFCSAAWLPSLLGTLRGPTQRLLQGPFQQSFSSCTHAVKKIQDCNFLFDEIGRELPDFVSPPWVLVIPITQFFLGQVVPDTSSRSADTVFQ